MGREDYEEINVEDRTVFERRICFGWLRCKHIIIFAILGLVTFVAVGVVIDYEISHGPKRKFNFFPPVSF